MVQDKVATLQEIRTFWDINEVLTAIEWLDILQDSEWLAHEESMSKARR